jgi:hypothetical protein
MSIPNREGWRFVASPRELQFAVVGAVAGVGGTLIAQAASAPAGAVFAVGVAACMAMFVLALARKPF